MSGALEKVAAVPASGFTTEQREMIRASFVPDATESEFAMLLEVARVRNLNPVTRQIHFVKRYNSQTKREAWAYQVSIDGLRAIAERTGRYDLSDEPEWVEKNGKLEFCRVKVYRKDCARPAVGVAFWAESVQLTREGKPTAMWAKYPKLMLAKCAEALALRKAFPEDLSGLYAEDELPEATVPHGEPRRAAEPDVLPPVQERKALAPAPVAAPAEEPPGEPEQTPAQAQAPAVEPAPYSAPWFVQAFKLCPDLDQYAGLREDLTKAKDKLSRADLATAAKACTDAKARLDAAVPVGGAS